MHLATVACEQMRVLRNVLYGVGVYDAPTMYNEVVSTTLMPL